MFYYFINPNNINELQCFTHEIPAYLNFLFKRFDGLSWVLTVHFTSRTLFGLNDKIDLNMIFPTAYL